jgi:hypothetical protein
MVQKDAGAANSPGQTEKLKDAAETATGQAATAQAIREAARDFSKELSGTLKDVLEEQRQLFANQQDLREADYVLVREMLVEQRTRQESDEMLRQEIDKKADVRRRDHHGPRPIDADPEQLLLSLQFNALSNLLGSRRRTGNQRDTALIPSPEILDSVGKGQSKYLMKFVAPLPAATETVVIQFLDGLRDEVPVDRVGDNYLGIDSDQVQFIELLDARETPIALGIPFRH